MISRIHRVRASDEDRIVSGGDSIAYTYNGDDELADEKETAFGGSTVYETVSTYDADGNLSTQITTGANASSSTYGYDLRNRMTSVTTDGETTTYAYDHTGVLIAETTDGVSTDYLNDPITATGYSKPIQQSNTPGGSPTLSYVLGLSVEAQSGSTNGTLYLLSDGHGSTRALTTSTGTIVAGQTFDYSGFGTPLDFDPATAKTVWLFGGDGRQDNASGLTYQLARWRAGSTFTRADSPGYGSDLSPLGDYLHSSEDPTSVVDPSGHDSLADGVIAQIEQLSGYDESLATSIGGNASNNTIALYTALATSQPTSQPSDQYMALIEQHEGRNYTVYTDTAGTPTPCLTESPARLLATR